MAEYLRKECGDINEVASDNDDVKDDDDANSKDVEVVEMHKWNTKNAWQVSKPEIPIKGRKELSCRYEIHIREDKSAEQKPKAYQWLSYIRIF